MWGSSSQRPSRITWRKLFSLLSFEIQIEPSARIHAATKQRSGTRLVASLHSGEQESRAVPSIERDSKRCSDAVCNGSEKHSRRMRGDDALCCTAAALISGQFVVKSADNSAVNRRNRGQEFKSTLLHISVSRVLEMAENRSKYARVRAICAHARAQRIQHQPTLPNLAKPTRRDLSRSADHRHSFACDSGRQIPGSFAFECADLALCRQKKRASGNYRFASP